MGIKISRLLTWLGSEPDIDGTTSDKLANGADTRLIAEPRVWFPGPYVSRAGTFLMIADRAYFVYMGRAASSITVNYIRAALTVNGSGTQTMEVGVFTGSQEPGVGRSVTMTKIAATGTYSDCTTGAIKMTGNTNPLAAAVAAGSYWFLGMRTNFATTQPTFGSLINNYGTGELQFMSTAGALTSSSSFAAGPVAFGAATTTAVAPALCASVD